MNVTEAVNRRASIRAFRPDPVPASVVREILALAARAPSGGNLQPWKVYALAGEPLAALKAITAANPPEPEPEFQSYPADLWEPLRSRRSRIGEEMYATINVAREDRAGRLAQFARNGQLFGAPVGLFFCLDRRCGPPQWADVAMMMNSVMLLALERGLDTCPQRYWSNYGQTLRRFLDLPDTEMVCSGMALGYRDESAPINSLRSSRDPLETWAELRGFD